jgi:hypothetical protein
MKNATTSYKEISKLIQKVSALGISVIDYGQRHSEKALTVIIVKENGIKEMMPYRFVKNDELFTGKSPFTWKLGEDEFVKWAKIATTEPFAMFNKCIAEIVKFMSVEDFEKLRRHEKLETEMNKYLYDELMNAGIGRVKLTKPALLHLSFIYGGLINRKEGIIQLISDLMDCVLEGHFIPDKCRSCMFCKMTPYKGTGRKCMSPMNEGFVIPSKSEFEDVLDKYPDINFKKAVKEGEGTTRFIPWRQKICDNYIRRK